MSSLLLAHGGDVCVLDGSVYQNGQTFIPSCKYQCMCRDGQITCVPRCNLDMMLPGPDCPMPRRVQVPGECCEKWVCDPQAEASSLGGFAMAGERTGDIKKHHDVCVAMVTDRKMRSCVHASDPEQRNIESSELYRIIGGK